MLGVLVIATRAPLIFAPEAGMRFMQRFIATDARVRSIGVFILPLSIALILLPASAGSLGGAERCGRVRVASEVDKFLSEWHRVVLAKDQAGLGELLADDISLGAPPYFDRLQGRELVHHLLGLILQTIDEFTYLRQWQQGPELALEFSGRVGELELQGIDLISLDGQFAITQIDVLIRPANAVEALRDAIAPQMAAFLARPRQGTA